MPTVHTSEFHEISGIPDLRTSAFRIRRYGKAYWLFHIKILKIRNKTKKPEPAAIHPQIPALFVYTELIAVCPCRFHKIIRTGPDILIRKRSIISCFLFPISYFSKFPRNCRGTRPPGSCVRGPRAWGEQRVPSRMLPAPQRKQTQNFFRGSGRTPA